jgi:hypothetical protein
MSAIHGYFPTTTRYLGAAIGAIMDPLAFADLDFLLYISRIARHVRP